MFLRLAEWEDTHNDLIQAELDHINRTGFWLASRSFRWTANSDGEVAVMRKEA